MKVFKALLVFSLLFCQLTFAANAYASQIVAPSQSGVLENGSTLEWRTDEAGINEWWVYVGPRAGARSYLDSGLLTGLEQLVVDGLPADGSAVHVRLWYRQSGSDWRFTDTSYQAALSSAAVQMASPVEGDVLSGASDTFTWDANGVAVDTWWLTVGTSIGGAQIFNSGNLGTATSTDVGGLVTDGSTVYVRLWHQFKRGAWRYIDTTYTAATLSAPTISSPTSGSGVSGGSVSISWQANETAVDQWWLYLGSSLGSNQYFDSGNLQTATSISATGLPEDGSMVYARLWHRQSNSVWRSVDAQFISDSDAGVEEPDPRSRPDPEPESTGFCEGFVSNTDSFVVPSMSKPAYMEPYNDPVFGGRVTRITNSKFGEVNKPAYSTMQAWNADESLLLIYRTGSADNAGHKLLDGHTYEFKQHLDITPADLEQVFWSRTDPDKFFYVSKRSADYGKFNRFSVSANKSTEVADLSAYCGSGLPSGGNDVQMHSVDDDLFGFSCRKNDGSNIMLSYKISTGDVVTAPIGTGTNWNAYTAPVPSASGDTFWHQGYVIGSDLKTVNHKLDLAKSAEHSSLGMTANGNDAYYQVSFGASPNGCNGDADNGVGHVVEHNLETGECRNIISQSMGYTYPTSSTHISALAYKKPNRVAVSSIGNRGQTPLFTNGTAAPPLFSEIYVAQTDPADTMVCRYAHHRSYGKSASNGGYAPYFGEPHATISPSGTRVIFGSDWYDSGSVDSFVLELPDYVKP